MAGQRRITSGALTGNVTSVHSSAPCWRRNLSLGVARFCPTDWANFYIGAATGLSWEETDRRSLRGRDMQKALPFVRAKGAQASPLFCGRDALASARKKRSNGADAKRGPMLQLKTFQTLLLQIRLPSIS